MMDARAAGAKGQWLVRSGSTVAGGPLAERSADEPAFTVTSRTDLWQAWEVRHGAQKNATVRTIDQPAATVLGSWDNGDTKLHTPGGVIRLTVRDALILQGFDPGYPVQGSRSKQFEQVGNAVPPPLAAAVVGALTGAAALERAS